VEIMTQRIELLAVSPAECRGGEKTVVFTIRPDRGSFRPHNVALSRSQAIRLLKSLRIVLRQSAGVFLLGLSLASVAGCSVEVVVSDKTSPKAADAPSTAAQEKKTAVHVNLLQRTEPSPVEQRPSTKEPAAAPAPRPAEEVGRTASPTVLIVENRIQVHEHVHIHEPPRSERVEVEIRRYDVERDEDCERRHRAYQQKVEQLKRLFGQ